MSEKIFDSEFTESAPAVEAYADFVAIIRQLRRDCPWDREQTHESVKHLLIEEAYETVEAIDREDWTELRKELGDLLLHVVFHSVMAEQDGRFTMKDVIDDETQKLVVRHPHVFGDTQVDGVGQVLTNWEEIKMKEKGRKSALDGVPAQLPALLRAHRMQEKAAGVGFDFPEASGAWDKVVEEVGEFGALAESEATPERLEDELGDVFFALVNYARFQGLNAENALRRTNDKFRRRFQHIEARLREQGRTPKDASLQEMDVYWDEAKAEERA
ncbi:MAG: nucleoside triphosphate pyrophosphohydrolase [Rhodothermales bacterium]|nr:nucleoside triphosphate pyrophosphohydrolase [Rhodothermales bacterium]